MISNYNGGEGSGIAPKYAIPIVAGSLMFLGGFTGFIILDWNYKKNIRSAIDVYNSCVGGSYQSSVNYKLQIGFSDISTPSIGLNISF
jgi:hypothetical protein